MRLRALQAALQLQEPSPTLIVNLPFALAATLPASIADQTTEVRIVELTTLR